jgi:hypothetical protein
MKKAIIPIAVVALLALGLAVGNEQGAEAEHAGERDIEVLDRNIRLTFALLDGDEDGSESMFIVTAVPKYKLLAHLDSGGEYAFAAIHGLVGPRHDGRILTLVEAEIVLGGEEAETELTVECGVLLKPGGEKMVAKWGDKKLIVHADYAD